MTTNELRAASAELVVLHQRFAPLFGRKEVRDHSLVYLRGLLAPLPRKSVEPIALSLGDSQVVPLQRFLTRSPWQAQAIQHEIQAVFAEQLVPSTASWTLGTVGVLDASDFTKQGRHSVGVARQHSGRLGTQANCQVGVFLVGVTPAGCALLDHQLYLPKSWSKARRLRRQTRIPKGTRFRTKPALAAELVQRTEAAGRVHFDWLVADQDYGKNHTLLDTLEARQQRYVLAVPATTLAWSSDPGPDAVYWRRYRADPSAGPRHVEELARRLPAEAWQTLQLRTGAKGPLVAQFAAVRVWPVRHHRSGPCRTLVVRRSLDPQPEIDYYLAHAPADTPLATLAQVIGCRGRVEQYFEDSKGYLGMAHYEARSWTSWHHHMSLVALAHLFVTLVRQRLKKKTPELTLDRTVALLHVVLPLPNLTEARALEILDYHLQRNRIAQKSHAKTWKRKHKKIHYEAPL
jgi:SRSO17 transposase